MRLIFETSITVVTDRRSFCLTCLNKITPSAIYSISPNFELYGLLLLVSEVMTTVIPCSLIFSAKLKRCSRRPDSDSYIISYNVCLLYTSDAADDLLCVDLGGRRIIKKKQTNKL